jgi:hypothetical protein
MQTIVVVCAQAREGHLSSGERPTRAIVDTSSRPDVRSPHHPKRDAKPAQHDESTPPFWTWFIENPRGSDAT